MPLIITGTLAFSITTALLCYGFMTLSGNEKEDTLSKSSVGVVIADDDAYTKMAVSYISSMKTIKNVCRIRIMNEDSAIKALKDAEIDALVYLPAEFISSVLNGINTPARIVLNNAGTNSQSALVRAIINAGVSDLATAQAGIYTVDNAVCILEASEEERTAINHEMNRIFLDKALNRGQLFTESSATATGDLNLPEFYFCSGCVLMILLSGISCAALLKPANLQLKRILRRSGIVHGTLPLMQALSCSIVLAIIFTAIMVLSPYGFSVRGIICILVILLTSFSFAVCIYRICKNEATGMLVIFLSSILMLFAAGGFIPEAFLPDLLPEIGRLLPAGAMLSCARAFLLGGTDGFLSCIIYSLLFLTACGFMDYMEDRSSYL